VHSVPCPADGPPAGGASFASSNSNPKSYATLLAARYEQMAAIHDAGGAAAEALV
jgi:hypothetical protein